MDAPDDAARYVTANIDEIPNIPYEWAPETEWKPVRRFFSIGSFGTNLFRAPKAGDVLTEDHTEDPESGTRHEELYLVVTGSATFKVDGAEFQAPAGTFVYVPDPCSVRGAVANEPGTALLAVGGEPGATFSPSEWDQEPIS
ncbi:MAG TPA: AraC family ligand binding domain-containing protein [Thermoleophilia bacterium]|nr:AraC family ligand binding domain-containing protein [Thermoleophilia bacterium]